jgi:hypothetical protein
MPGGDSTGPVGMGPMTGKGAGFCAGYPTGGWGFRGCGRGWRHWFRATGQPHWMRFGTQTEPRPEAENQALRNRANALQEELDFIKKRLAENEADTAQT